MRRRTLSRERGGEPGDHVADGGARIVGFGGGTTSREPTMTPSAPAAAACAACSGVEIPKPTATGTDVAALLPQPLNRSGRQLRPLAVVPVTDTVYMNPRARSPIAARRSAGWSARRAHERDARRSHAARMPAPPPSGGRHDEPAAARIGQVRREDLRAAGEYWLA